MLLAECPPDWHHQYRLPRWDPRYWGHLSVEDESRCRTRLRELGLAWARAHAKTRGLRAERAAHACERERQLAHDELSLKPEDAIPRCSEPAVPPPVSSGSGGVISAIHFNHEARSWRAEINDEAPQYDLPPEGHAKLAATNCPPQALLRGREHRAHGGGTSREQLSASDIELLFFQRSLLVPAKWPGVAPLGAGSVTRARRVARAQTARGAERAPSREARPLRRDEVRRKQVSSCLQSALARTAGGGSELIRSQQRGLHLAGAAPLRADLPHSRAARAAVLLLEIALDAHRSGAREHEFGEGRAPAGGNVSPRGPPTTELDRRGRAGWGNPGNDPINQTDISGLLAGVPDWLLWLDDHGALQAAGDFSAGVSSALTFGVSDKLIALTGLGAYGSRCSGAYFVGNVAGMAVGFIGGSLAGAAESVVAEGAEATSTALSNLRQTAEGEQFFHYGYAEQAANFEQGILPGGLRNDSRGVVRYRSSIWVSAATRDSARCSAFGISGSRDMDSGKPDCGGGVRTAGRPSGSPIPLWYRAGHSFRSIPYSIRSPNAQLSVQSE
jgi:hypothetical protein